MVIGRSFKMPTSHNVGESVQTQRQTHAFVDYAVIRSSYETLSFIFFSSLTSALSLLHPLSSTVLAYFPPSGRGSRAGAHKHTQ